MTNVLTIILFEDEAAGTLEPITLTRAVWDLRCGLNSFAEKIKAHFPQAQFFHRVRPHLVALCNDPDPSSTPFDRGGSSHPLWINGSFIPGERFSDVVNLSRNTAWIQNGRVVAFKGDPPNSWTAGSPLLLEGFDKIEITSEFGQLYSYLWELVGAVGSEIKREARVLRSLGEVHSKVHATSVILNEKDIFIAPGCDIGPLAILDATLGPVILDKKVQIGAHVLIEGPTYLGPKSRIKPFAHIKECCFGEETRVGGEVVDTIIQGFSNKQHSGFLGNSYLGSWCNLGSGTETSNLKNNYTPVKVQVGRDLVDSGSLFVGLMMGDHSKSAIGSVFNTGTVVGVACNLIEPGFPPRYIPSFHWGGAQKLTPYPFNKTLEIARAVMARRGRTLSDTEIEVLRWIHDHNN